MKHVDVPNYMFHQEVVLTTGDPVHVSLEELSWFLHIRGYTGVWYRDGYLFAYDNDATKNLIHDLDKKDEDEKDIEDVGLLSIMEHRVVVALYTEMPERKRYISYSPTSGKTEVLDTLPSMHGGDKSYFAVLPYPNTVVDKLVERVKKKEAEEETT